MLGQGRVASGGEVVHREGICNLSTAFTGSRCAGPSHSPYGICQLISVIIFSLCEGPTQKRLFSDISSDDIHMS